MWPFEVEHLLTPRNQQNDSNSGGTVFDWFLNISAVAGFIAWTCIGISHICFMRALRAQGISRDDLPYKAFWQPWFSWYGIGFNIIIIITNGFTVRFEHILQELG